ncbi:unnamed protein product, partial [Closterium sp. Naga37s-1]
MAYYSRTAVVFALLLQAASSAHRLVAGYSWPLSEAASTRREMAKAPATCPNGVACPEGASCAVDGLGFPFCKCAAGQAIINGVCATAASWTAVGTSVALYKHAKCKVNASDVEPLAVLRAPPPNTSTCVTVPSGFNGTLLGCLRILWNVNDGAPDHLVCGKVVFWDQPDCTGLSTTVEIAGGWTKTNPSKFNTATEIQMSKRFVKTQSLSCLAAVMPPFAGLCATASCPTNSQCTLKNSSFAQCTCDPGLIRDGPACVDPCSLKDCGEGGTCVKLPNRQLYCDCKQGYEMEGVSGSCIGQGQCKNCLQSTLGSNSLPYTYCAPGFNIRSGTCAPGFLPDVADVSISVFSSLGFGTTSPPYVFRLKPFTCVTIPDAVVTTAKSLGILYRAPGSYMRCAAVVYYVQPNCGGTPMRADVPAGNDITELALP